MNAKCWLCGYTDLMLVKPAKMPSVIDSNAFRITDAHYGRCGAVYQCRSCGFRQCSELDCVLGFYETMEDPDYEKSREPRALQAKKLLRHLRPYRASGRLLDIGAGSGILVEQALRLGYEAEGVEPSKWLATSAHERGLPVHHGALPLDAIKAPFDIVMLIDVIEHVSDPVGLLRNAREIMASDGIGLVVTPDVSSIAARLMGHRWWHYRVAHVCYFTRPTLDRALSLAGLRPIRTFRPAWYFTADYLLDRLAVYAAPARYLRSVRPRITVPLNLYDSVAMVFGVA